MSKTYIELSSAYRDRYEYPNPAEFIVKACELTGDDSLSTRNPISDAYPFYNFWSLPLTLINTTTSAGTWSLIPVNYGTKPYEMKFYSSGKNNNPAFPAVEPGAEPDVPGTTACIGTASKPVFRNVVYPTITISNYRGTDSSLSPVKCGNIPESLFNYTLAQGLVQETDNLCCPNNFFDGMTMSNFISDASSYDLPLGMKKNALFVDGEYNITESWPGPLTVDGQWTTDALSSSIAQFLNCNSDILPCDNVNLLFTDNSSTGASTAAVWTSLVSQGTLLLIEVKDNGFPVNYILVRVTDITGPLPGPPQVFRIRATLCKCNGNFLNGSFAVPSPPKQAINIWTIDSNFQSHMFSDDSIKLNLQTCKECSQIVSSTGSSTLSLNRCCSNNLNCIGSCPPIDSISFGVEPSFSGPYRCLNWENFPDTPCIPCPKEQTYPLILNSNSWNCIRIQGGFGVDMVYNCSVLEFIPVPINAPQYYPQALSKGLADRFKRISGYAGSTRLASFSPYNCCNDMVDKTWQKMIYWMLWAQCGESIEQLPYNPSMSCSEYAAAISVTTSITPCPLADSCPDPVPFYKNTNNYNYLWNFRMRRDIPELIATASLPTAIDIPIPSAGNLLYNTSPPLFLFAVPYDLEIINGGSGYTRGGYFIYGTNNFDLIEIQYNVDCGKIVSAAITKLQIDPQIYNKLLGTTPDEQATNYELKTCKIPNPQQNFNPFIPDIMEINHINIDTPAQGTGPFTYNWNGQSKRNNKMWFGGSNACIRIKKGNGFFSNIGQQSQTNYASNGGNSQQGPGSNNCKGELLYIPSLVEQCYDSKTGSIENTLDFSTRTSTSLLNDPKYYRQYPVTMKKEPVCGYDYAKPPFDAKTTGTTAILANFSTEDIPIYWSTPTSTAWMFFGRPTGALPAANLQIPLFSSVLITEQSFFGYPLNINGLYELEPDGETITKQCCSYEWEILSVSSSGVNNANTIIPKSSTQEMTCWRINLRNIVLPNVTLLSGSSIAFYPYLYVELSNVTEIGRQHGMIQSNNPNSKPALFRAAVTDIATPIITKFIKLTGDGMYQTVKFRPNDDLKIRVYLPDGRDFATVIKDTAPPGRPDPLAQISALFEVEKI